MSALAATEGVGRLRRIHLGMIDAVLAGGGPARVAALAADELHGTVRIVLPASDVDVTAPALRDARAPSRTVAEVPVRSGDETLGSVALLDAAPSPEAHEVLELAALAALTAVTLRDANVTQRRATAGLLDDIARGLPAAEILARARRLGADLSAGASALAVRPPAGHADRVLATIAQELPGSLAAVRGNLVEALVPGSARRAARRLGASMPVGMAPLEADAGRFATALRIASVALELEGVDAEELLGGSWCLLLATGATNPGALQALVDSTVGPAGDLLDTLRAYITHGASLKSTADAIYAHRHTVSNRLERVRALTGHDPQTPAGQAQLALGLQALDVQHALNQVMR